MTGIPAVGIRLGADVPSRRIVRRLLSDWTTRMMEYRAAQPDDWPFWYTERSNCSMLASAAWKQGVALEEFDVRRGHVAGGKKGRCDLWMKIGSFRCAMEFKQLWPRSASDRFAVVLRGAVKDAKRQLSTLPKEETTADRFAGCFVTPELSTVGAVDDSLASFVEYAKRALASPRSLVCWFGVQACGNATLQLDKHARTYPGVILAGEFV